jgi:alpha-L-fucosidase
MKFKRSARYLIILFGVFSSTLLRSQHIEELQRNFTDLRFGAFLHFGIRTFTGGSWGEANQDISAFNPDSLDCNQWAEAMVAAGMKFGILTTKHHDGFCLWDSEYTENDVASGPWKGGEGDVIREYVDAFRANGLEPCLYYSVWDNTAGIGNGTITGEDMDIIKGQLTEILSNYGEIKLLFIDGWSWKMGHKSVPYDEIHTLVKELQPNCLLIDNTHLPCLYDNDMIHFEAGGEYPEGNSLPALFSLLINTNGGNGWFWDSDIPTANLMSVNQIVNNTLNVLEPQWVTFVLNTPPNNKGLLDNNIVSRLKQVGEAWAADTGREPLPKQQPQIIEPVTPASASATSGNANYAIDGLNDRFYYSVWQTDSPLPHSITIDLGEEYGDVSTLSYVPKYIPYINPLTEGSIKDFKIYTSTDNIDYTEVYSGRWNGDIDLKVAVFEPAAARYIKLEALTAVDGFAAVTEIAIGRGDAYEPNSTLISSRSCYSDIIMYNYPNPIHGTTTISYELDRQGKVNLTIYDLSGRIVETLVNKYQTANRYSVEFHTSCMTEGLYIYELKINEATVAVNKMVIVGP